MGKGGRFCDFFLLGFGDNHDLGVLPIFAGIEIVLYINEDSNRNSNTLS